MAAWNLEDMKAYAARALEFLNMKELDRVSREYWARELARVSAEIAARVIK